MGIVKFILVAFSLAVVLGVVESFDYHEQDTFEESLWDLYERWRSHHTVSLLPHREAGSIQCLQEFEIHSQGEPKGQALQVEAEPVCKLNYT
ncbi:hypothetical protein SLE2022_231770 [Rubroshorea leprosula]